MSARLVVIGGGLAGIAVAVRLAEAGHKPLLIETKKKLGGRATSFIDPRNERELDNCQHVVMGCCTHLLDLFSRIGVLDRIQWHRELFWTKGDGIVDVIRPARLPAPFHMALALGRLSFLGKQDRAAIRRAMWRLIRLGPAGRQRWTGRAFSEFLAEQRQTENAIRCFWTPIIVSACNVALERCECSYAMQVFQEGFLANAWGGAVGLPTVPLWRLYDPAVDFIESRGGDVVDGVSARSLAFDGTRITGVVTPDGMIPCTSVVTAVPFDRLDKLVSDTLRRADARLQALDRFEISPILGVHLWFETPVMSQPHLVVVDAGVQWLFNKGVDEAGRQHLHAVISAADEWMELPEETIVDRVMVDLHRVLPRSRGLRPVEARAVKEKRATFALTPGIDAIRPRSAPGPIGLHGAVPNLYLAGDWCDTGWPATMEGAVRSGYEAAGAVTGQDCGIGDLPPGPLARVLGLKPAGRIA